MKNFLFFILICVISSQNDKNICPNEPDEQKCFSVKLETPDNGQCCVSNGSCFFVPFISYLYGSSVVYKRIQKEIYGFNPLFIEFKGKCKNGEISLSNSEMEYTKEDSEIVKSNNYCLNYHKSVKDSSSIIKSKENCFKATILDSSSEIGLECGYYDFTINSEYGEKKIQTCFLLNPSILSQSYVDIDIWTKDIMNGIAKDLSGSSKYNSYTCKIYSSNGNSKLYDSNEEILEEITNSSKTIIISKIIFLLFLILIF